MGQLVYNQDMPKGVPGMQSKDFHGAYIVSYPAAEPIPPGRLVVLNSDGKAELPQDSTIAKPIGISVFSPTNPSPLGSGFVYAIGDMVSIMRRGRAYADVSGGSPEALTRANVNHSSTLATNRGKFSAGGVANTAGSEVSNAGPAMFVEPGETGQWLLEVDFYAVGFGDGSAAGSITALTAFASGDTAPASIVNGGVYDIPTTAANSTISLPAATPDGTVAFFHADGTKNGHTLTFRDVATNISAATTASKRVAAVAIKADGKWVVTLTVGP